MKLEDHKAQMPSGATLQEAHFAPGELAKSVRPLIMPPARFDPSVVEGAPVILPGLVMATALHVDDQVHILPAASLHDLGGAQAVWRQALQNVENLENVQIVREDVDSGRDDTGLVTLTSADPFVASRVAVLAWLELQLHGSASPHGVLVAIPHLRKLMLHAIRGPGVLLAVETMGLVAHHLFDTAPEAVAISSDVFFVAPDGRAQRATYLRNDKVHVDLTKLLGETLSALTHAR